MMKSEKKAILCRVLTIAIVTAGILIMAVISMLHGHYTFVPYFFLLPVLLVVFFWPKYGVIYSVLLGWIYVTIVYYVFSWDLPVLAESTAWFYIIVSIGIVLSSFASGQKQEGQKYRTIFEYSEAGLFTCTHDLKQITGSNPKLGNLLGYDTADLQDKELGVILPDGPTRESLYSALLDSGHIRNREIQLQTRKNGLLWVLFSSASVDEKTVICSVTDLSDRKFAEDTLRNFNATLEDGILNRTADLNAALKEKSVLLREVNHRVKNNLQMIISLLNLQVRSTADEKIRMALCESRNRVQAIVIVHQKFNESESYTHVDLQDCIRFLVQQIFRTYTTDTRKIRFVIDIEDLRVEIDTAITICMMINELVTNSLKYAFPAGGEGKIEIRGSRNASNIVLEIGDDGTGLPRGFDWKNPKTLGLMIVTMLVQQMHGTIEYLHGRGTVFTIVLEEREVVAIHSVGGLERTGDNNAKTPNSQ